MAIHPEVFSMMIACSMTNMIQSAAQHVEDRRDQAVFDAWLTELASARGNAAAMSHVATSAVRQLVESEAEVEGLRDEVARLRTLLAQRNRLIRQLSQ